MPAGRARGTVVDVKRMERWLLIPAACVTIFGILHHLDHTIRGNHVGWPLQATATPFTFSLLIYLFLVPGIFLTRRGRVWAGYWLAVAVAGLALVTWVHFGPAEGHESLHDIVMPYADPAAYCRTSVPAGWEPFFCHTYLFYASPFWAALAVGDLCALLLSLVALIVAAIRVRRLSGRW